MTQTEVQEFQERTKLLVLSIANVAGKAMDDGKTLDGRAGIEVCYVTFTCWNTTEHIHILHLRVCTFKYVCYASW